MPAAAAQLWRRGGFSCFPLFPKMRETKLRALHFSSSHVCFRQGQVSGKRLPASGSWQPSVMCRARPAAGNSMGLGKGRRGFFVWLKLLG